MKKALVVWWLTGRTHNPEGLDSIHGRDHEKYRRYTLQQGDHQKY